MRNNKF